LALPAIRIGEKLLLGQQVPTTQKMFVSSKFAELG